MDIVNVSLAYINPGVGSLVVQAILVVFAGSFLFIKSYWRTIKSFFAAKKKK